MTGKPVSDPLLDRRQAALYLGLTNPNTLAVWDCTKRYDLKPLKIGRSVRYRKSSLDEFMKQCLEGRKRRQMPKLQAYQCVCGKFIE